MERPPASLAALLRSHAAPAVVLLTGLLSAVGAALFVSRVVAAQQDARFRAEVSASLETLRDHMEAYTAMLLATRGLFEAMGEEPDLGTFRRFVESLDIGERFPGIQGIGWAKALRPDEIAAHEAQVRAAGRPGYLVWPQGERPLYAAIMHLEPLDWRNERAIGYDMFSDPTRREAMERARDTGEVAASGKVELVQEAGSERQAGFLMYLPVYARPAHTIEERRRLLIGWVYAPFRAANLLGGTLGTVTEGAVGFDVFDGPAARPGTFLYGAEPVREGSPRSTRVERLEIAGRTWTLRYAATSAFGSRTERLLPGAVLAAGLAVATLLFWITRADAQGRARAEKAARRSSFLAEAGKALSASMETEQTVADVAALAARRIADACLVLLVEGSGPTWFAGHRDAGVARRAADALRGVGPTEAGVLGVQAALASGEPRLESRLAALQVRRGGPVAIALRVVDARALLTVPLLARGEPLGAIVLVSTHRPFEEEDLPLAQDLARLAAAAVDASRLYRRAQEAVAARDEFLSIASHELKTPLTSLTLHADGLRSAAGRRSPELIAGKADVIRRSVDRLARLVSSLLDISRIGSGRLDLEIEELDLADVAREVVERFEDEARRARCTIVLEAEPVRGRWDRTRLDQVLTNLVSNALKYGPEKPVLVRVEPGPGRAILSVQDHGIGISEADQRRIFQRFERAVSRRNYGGFGLGLWIVRQIVEALGGAVRVASVPGEGSTFTVELATGIHAPRPGGGDRARPIAPSP